MNIKADIFACRCRKRLFSFKTPYKQIEGNYQFLRNPLLLCFIANIFLSDEFETHVQEILSFSPLI